MKRNDVYTNKEEYCIEYQEPFIKTFGFTINLKKLKIFVQVISNV